MKDPGVQQALRGIQQLVAEATGAPLGGEAAAKLQALLSSLGGQRAPVGEVGRFASREVTILLADLRGFTSVAAKQPPGVVLEMLNRYLARMSGIVYANGGVIDKFMGDAIMGLFGAPVAHPDDPRRAITCAVQMQRAMDELNRANRLQGLPELFMGIGINSGEVMAGLLGSDVYYEYTVIGDEVNLASRIEAFSLRGQVLVSENTYRRAAGFVDAAEPLSVLVKGKRDPVLLREVRGIPSLGLEVPRMETRRSPRVEAAIPFTYRRVENKIVLPSLAEGRTRDVSYHGVVGGAGGRVSWRDRTPIDIDLSLAGRRGADVYAKVLKSFVVDGRHLCGIEFTSTDPATAADLRTFVQLLMQGSATK